MKKSLLILPALCLAAFSAGQGAQLLRIKAKPGQVMKYVMDMQSGTSSQSMKMGMGMTMKVAAVKNGQWTIHSTIGNVTMNGQPAPAAATEQLKKMLMVTVMDSRATVLKSETRGIAGMPNNSQGTSVPFPKNPVKVGSTWSGSASIQGQKVETSYKLIAFKPVNGKAAAVIHATPKGMANFKTNGPIVYSVELATGFPLSMSMTGTVTQGTNTQTMKMTMRRV